MKINIRNMAIVILMFLLISSQIIGTITNLVKTFAYCVVFLFILKRVNEGTYNYIVKLFNLDKYKLTNVPSTLANLLSKLLKFLPEINENSKDIIDIKNL